MSIFDKVLLTLVSILLILLSIFLILFTISNPNLISLNDLSEILANLKGNYIYIALGVFLILVSLRFIYISIGTREKVLKDNYIIQRSDFGQINISQNTIVGLAHSVTDKFTGIRNVKTKVDIVEGQLYLDLSGEVVAEINIPQTTEELQKKVKEHIEYTTGIGVNEIRVIITDVTSSIRNIK